MSGPETDIGQWIHGWKYRSPGESFDQYSNRVAQALQDSPEHFRTFREILRDQRFLPGGRIQSAMGAIRQSTPYNCFVMEEIKDDMQSILGVFGEAVETMRRGGGVGYDFSKLRPWGDRIKTLDSIASGPVSFMGIFDAGCKTVSSAGHRRGAQMGVLRVDHPDIERFIHAKQNSTNLTAFNVSVAVTDAFMEAVEAGTDFDLQFEGKRRGSVDARALWETIMRSTWDWAEPGVIFIDTINRQNNLWYCETIAATNPCGEQPLPPNGACLLGSYNLPKYVRTYSTGRRYFDWQALRDDVAPVVRAMDNVVSRARYPLRAQENEAMSKRRMGLGVTGLANAGEAMGHPYGSAGFLEFEAKVLAAIRDDAYHASIELAAEKGPFPLFEKEQYGEGAFIKTLPSAIQKGIQDVGIRNSHLTSIAPTGTISIAADNVSSGVEPVFSLRYDRTIQVEAGERVVSVEDYGQRVFGTRGKTAAECSVDDHLGVLLTAQRYVDSACSKTCNVSPDMPWADFKEIYTRAWKGGAKGITTFNPGGNRFGILQAPDEPSVEEPLACYVNPDTGERSCE
jgi:ribonucleoside-diphosphate reductase alpha chain